MAGGFGKNLFALDSALFASELVNRLTHDHDPHLVLFDQFTRFLQYIDAMDAASGRRDILLQLVLFQLALLHEVGLRPNFKACANCAQVRVKGSHSYGYSGRYSQFLRPFFRQFASRVSHGIGSIRQRLTYFGETGVQRAEKFHIRVAIPH